MMDQIFDWCVNVLVYWAGILGITYKEINVLVFVIIWPILTIIMALLFSGNDKLSVSYPPPNDSKHK